MPVTLSMAKVARVSGAVALHLNCMTLYRTTEKHALQSSTVCLHKDALTMGFIKLPATLILGTVRK